jgi:hypothetical protein
LECGGLTPLWLYQTTISETAVVSLLTESSVKPPRSKFQH